MVIITPAAKEGYAGDVIVGGGWQRERGGSRWVNSSCNRSDSAWGGLQWSEETGAGALTALHWCMNQCVWGIETGDESGGAREAAFMVW